MAETVNERILSAAIGHMVDLTRYSNGVAARMMALLNRVDGDLFARLTDALEQAGESPSTERLEQLLGSVRSVNLQAYQTWERELTGELRQLADYEAGHQAAALQAALPEQVVATVSLARVNAEQVYAAAMSQPFRGRLLREWASGLEASRMARIRDAVRIGYVEGETISQMVRRIRGSRAERYADGLIQIDRRDAEAVVRTAVSHIAAVVKDRHQAANGDIIKAVAWRSTLDGRTSSECRIRDGLRYTLEGHQPIGHRVPWLSGPGRLHWQCRSTSTAVVKSWRELGFDIDELLAGTRAAMDGQEPAQLTYGQWLKKQSAARQDDILGPTRGALLRRGRLDMEAFYNEKGRMLSLEELRQRDARAFSRAGL